MAAGPIAQDAGKWLVDGGIGVINVDLLLGSNAKVPAGAGPYTTLIDTGGTSPIRTQDDGDNPAYRRPSLQARTRATDYMVAWNKLTAISKRLTGARNVTINGNTYIGFYPKGEIADMGLDEAGRPNLVINFDVTVHKA